MKITINKKEHELLKDLVADEYIRFFYKALYFEKLHRKLGG